MEFFQIRAIFHFVAAFSSFSLFFVFLLKSKKKLAFYISLMLLSTAVYAFCFGVFFLSPENRLFWSRAAWSGNFVISCFIIFSYVLANKTKYLKLKIIFWSFFPLFNTVVSLTTPYFNTAVSSEYPYYISHGFLDPFGRLYVAIGTATGLYILLNYYFKIEQEKKVKMKYFIMGIAIYAVGGILFTGIIPFYYSVFKHGAGSPFPDLAPIVSSVAIILSSYAVFRKKLFEIRIILVEVLIVAVGLILLIQAITAKEFIARIFGLFIFFVFSIVGYLLTRVIKKEIQGKERAENLSKKLKHFNETLEQKVADRTKKLEKNYLEIKKRKNDLEGFYNLAVGRELKMIEMKKKIKELKG